MFFLKELEYLKTNVNVYKHSITFFFLNSSCGNTNYIHIFVICRKLNIQPGISDQEVWLHYITAIKVIYWLKNCATFY